MGSRVRPHAATAKLNEVDLLGGLGQLFPPALLDQVVRSCGRQSQRCRKLPATLTLLLPIASALFPTCAQAQVLSRLLLGVRLRRGCRLPPPAGRSAICQARHRLGPRPLVALFHAVCQPLATPQTVPDAFYGRWRLLALDGTREDTADSPANARAFDRPRTQRGERVGAFPQVWAVYLLECGTHAVLDAGLWSCRTGERTGGYRLLRSVDCGSLLLWDAGLHSYAMAQRTRTRGAHFLSRLPAHVRPVPVRRLADGSELVWLYPGADWQRRGRERLLVRLLRYRVTDPGWGPVGTEVRLITSLLNPVRHPLLRLITLYHQRWEVELGIDELDTHLRQLRQPLPGRTPVQVVQEVYGLLLAHYLVRSLLLQAALRARTAPLRLSFGNAVHLVTALLNWLQGGAPREQQRRYRFLLAELARFVLPPRDNRSNPRVVRRKVGKFPVKRTTDRGPTRRTVPLAEGISLI